MIPFSPNNNGHVSVHYFLIEHRLHVVLTQNSTLTTVRSHIRRQYGNIALKLKGAPVDCLVNLCVSRQDL